MLADGQDEAGIRELRLALTMPQKMKYDNEAKRRAQESLAQVKN